jgi:hypothetical protein
MAMASGLRKALLTAHVTSSVGFLGAVAGFLALAVAGLAGQDAGTVHAAYVAMGLMTWSVIIPLCFASLLTGVVQSLATPWGLFRHYWVLVKFLLTVFTTIVLLLQLEGIRYMAEMAAATTLSAPDLTGLRRSLRTHAAGGLLVLLLATVLSVYKPRGVTRYGWRKQQEQEDSGPAFGQGSADPLPYPGAPRWAKTCASIALGLVLLLALLVFTGIGGPHGPGRHIPVTYSASHRGRPPEAAPHHHRARHLRSCAALRGVTAAMLQALRRRRPTARLFRCGLPAVVLERGAHIRVSVAGLRSACPARAPGSSVLPS